MAARNHLVVFSLIFVILEINIRCTVAKNCTIKEGSRQFIVTDWTWEYRSSKNVIYKLNLCSPLECEHHPPDSAVCRINGGYKKAAGLLDKKSVKLAADNAGFTITYQGPDNGCEKIASGKWHTTVVMKCGKFLGSPILVEESVSKEGCWAVFEFVTNEACKSVPREVEIPCTIHLSDGKRRDLTPLIKLQGGYEVASQDKNYDYHINVCRGITAETQSSGHTHGCPKGSGSCRVEPKASKAIGMGQITAETRLEATSRNQIVLKYKGKESVDCNLKLKIIPVTTITFVCPKELHQSGARGPVMTADTDCQFEILWETEFACPVNTTLQNNTGCIIHNEFVSFDLTPLAAPALSNYKVNSTDEAGTVYWYYINVCKSTNIPCTPSGMNASVCQERQDQQKATSLGEVSQMSLRYADGQLVLTYKGGAKCHNGLNRSTIITFKCNVHAEKGYPVFSYEDHCFYFFDWETRYACPPSRRTGSRCRVASSKGVRYDLSELVRMDASKNWLAIDGEQTGSDRAIYINVCQSLVFQAESSGCKPAAAVCIKDGNTVKSLGRYTDPPTLDPDGSIKLVYTMGDQCKKTPDGTSVLIQTTVIFVCQPGDLESPPALVSKSQDGCLYTFMWRTAAACPLGVNSGDNCKVADKEAGYVFDLSELAKHGLFNANDTKYMYELKVCNSAVTTCGNTSACQYDKSDKSKHWNIGKPSSKLYYYDGMLNLTYTNGENCKHLAGQGSASDRQTHITFLCKPNSGFGNPVHEKEDECHHNFIWYTQYACPGKTMECAARSGGDQYDLASLVKTQDNWESVSDRGRFYINVCRSLNLGPSVKGCSGTASVCFKTAGGKFINLGQVSSSPQVIREGTVEIRYTGGDKCDAGKYSAIITFICKTGSVGNGPRFQEIQNKCAYKFVWETDAACPIKNNVGDNCAVQDPKSDTVFNLYPLKKVYQVNATNRYFLLDICGSLPRGKCNSIATDVGSCEIDTSSTPTKKIVLGKTSTKLAFEGEILMLSYRDGGRYKQNGQPRKVNIRFYCNPSIPFGEVKFTEQQAQVYSFEVQTSLACPAKEVQCFVTDDQKRKYDLTPLGLKNGNWEAVDGRLSNKHLHYFINVCRPYNPPSQGIRCPGGAIGACQFDHKLGRGHNMGYVQSNPQVAANGDLVLRYLGGDTCHKQFNRSTRIIFSCSKTMGAPTFVAESQECEYLFTWQTPSACPLTRETGYNCTVIDKQYDYKFNLTQLNNNTKDHQVGVFGVPDSYILLNGCGKLSSSLPACKGKGVCLITKANPSGQGLAVNETLTYYNGEISQKFLGKEYSVEVRFLCDQQAALGIGPSVCEKKKDGKYTCTWPTPVLCRPASHAQCSIRVESKDDKADRQYDFTRLAKSEDNWQARVTSASNAAAYYINVCRSLVLKGDAGQCPPTAGVCKVDLSLSGDAAGKKKYMSLGTLRSGPRLGNSTSSSTDNIYLLYEGGDLCENGVNASSRIQMECGMGSQGEPIFVSMFKEKCRYEFLWITDIACPINTINPSTSKDCTAVNPQTNVLFDLKPLKKTSGEDYSVNDQTGHSYVLNVCAGVVSDKGKLCGSKSGICQRSTADDKFHKNAGNANDVLHFSGGTLSLNYSGGDYCHHSKSNRQTIISFVCNSTHDAGHGKPVFITETDDCTYYINWHTNLVCEREVECVVFANSKDGRKVKYSLKSLIKHDQNWQVVPVDGSTSDSFYINVCRPLVPIAGVNCPAGAFACHKNKKGEIESLGRISEPPLIDDDGTIKIVYENGSKCHASPGANLRTQIKLTCARGTEGKPLFLGASGDPCTYTFTWSTSAACPIGDEVADFKNCRVYDNATDHWYDLRPLQGKHQLSYRTVTKGGSKYHISLCQKVSINECNGGGVCLDASGKFTALGLVDNGELTYYHDEQILVLKYCEKKGCDPSRIMSRITFICDETATLESNPTLVFSDTKGAEFIWKTSLVCPPMQKECVYHNKGKTYDLQLLSSKSKSWDYTASDGEQFWINICRGINHGPPGCPPHASVCKKTPSGTTSEVLGYLNTQKITMSVANDISVKYVGGKVNEHSCLTPLGRSLFQFKCGKHVGQPKLISKLWSSCTFIFEWKTVAACDTEREKITEDNCEVEHPLTGQRIDFSKLSPPKGAYSGYWKINTASQGKYFYLKLCDNGASSQSNPCDSSLCKEEGGSKTELQVKSREFFYEDYLFELWLTTKTECQEKPNVFVTVIINFQCSYKEIKGKPVYQYESVNCHHYITWPTSIVCPSDEGGIIVDPAEPRLETSEKKTKSGVGIALGVLAAFIVIAVLVYVLYKPERRQNLAFKLRWHVRRYILCKDSKVPVYRYQKINAGDDDEADALLKEEGEGSDLFDDDEVEDDDDDLLDF